MTALRRRFSSRIASMSPAKAGHSGGGISRLTRSYSRAVRARAWTGTFIIYTPIEHIYAITEHKLRQDDLRHDLASGSLVPANERSASTAWRNWNSLAGRPTESA